VNSERMECTVTERKPIQDVIEEENCNKTKVDKYSKCVIFRTINKFYVTEG
jgi:hypothetical protein